MMKQFSKEEQALIDKLKKAKTNEEKKLAWDKIQELREKERKSGTDIDIIG